MTLHSLRFERGHVGTLGVCSCGGWQREVSTETVAITGRSREESLRAAHDEHVRGV